MASRRSSHRWLQVVKQGCCSTITNAADEMSEEEEEVLPTLPCDLRANRGCQAPAGSQPRRELRREQDGGGSTHSLSEDLLLLPLSERYKHEMEEFVESRVRKRLQDLEARLRAIELSLGTHCEESCETTPTFHVGKRTHRGTRQPAAGSNTLVGFQLDLAQRTPVPSVSTDADDEDEEGEAALKISSCDLRGCPEEGGRCVYPKAPPLYKPEPRYPDGSPIPPLNLPPVELPHLVAAVPDSTAKPPTGQSGTRLWMCLFMLLNAFLMRCPLFLHEFLLRILSWTVGERTISRARQSINAPTTHSLSSTFQARRTGSDVSDN